MFYFLLYLILTNVISCVKIRNWNIRKPIIVSCDVCTCSLLLSHENHVPIPNFMKQDTNSHVSGIELIVQVVHLWVEHEVVLLERFVWGWDGEEVGVVEYGK